MRVAESVPGLLVLEVRSRSRGPEVIHYVTLDLAEDGTVARVACSCEAASFGLGCHHLASLEDLDGGQLEVDHLEGGD